MYAYRKIALRASLTPLIQLRVTLVCAVITTCFCALDKEDCKY